MDSTSFIFFFFKRYGYHTCSTCPFSIYFVNPTSFKRVNECILVFYTFKNSFRTRNQDTSKVHLILIGFRSLYGHHRLLFATLVLLQLKEKTGSRILSVEELQLLLNGGRLGKMKLYLRQNGDLKQLRR